MGYAENLAWRRELPEGWLPMFEKLVAELHELRDDVKIVQAKEKFGELRVYLRQYPEGAHALIDAATQRSRLTCESCGAPGILCNDDGYYLTVCQEHRGEAIPAATDPIQARYRITDEGLKKVDR